MLKTDAALCPKSGQHLRWDYFQCQEETPLLTSEWASGEKSAQQLVLSVQETPKTQG